MHFTVYSSSSFEALEYCRNRLLMVISVGLGSQTTKGGVLKTAQCTQKSGQLCNKGMINGKGLRTSRI